MQDLTVMSATGTARAPFGKPTPERDEIVSFHLLPPLPYSTTLIPAERFRETIIQVVRERQAKEREAALDGNTAGQ